MKTKTALLLFLFIVFSQIGCDKAPEYRPNQDSPKKSDRLTKEEIETSLPNKIFIAAYDKDYVTLEELLISEPQLLETRTSETKESTWEMTIRLNDHKATEMILKALPIKYFFEGNSKQESLILHLARQGWSDLIANVAQRYYQSLGRWQNYEFSNLDFPNLEEQTSIFYAKNSAVVESLKQEYYRGLLELPFYSFLLKEDNFGQSFLHTAAKDQRIDILLWASEDICATNRWASSSSKWKNIPGMFWQYGIKLFQAYSPDIGLHLGLIFNKPDAEGKTPLHVAAQGLNKQTIHAITSCQWIDIKIKDNSGKTPLHLILESLDSENPNLETQSKQLVSHLLDIQTPTRPFLGKAKLLNQQDNSDNTPLHVAARLADPDIYNQLSVFGNIHLKNNEGVTPQESFDRTRALYESR